MSGHRSGRLSKGPKMVSRPLVRRRTVKRGWSDDMLKADPCAYCGRRGGTLDHIHPKTLHEAEDPAQRKTPWFLKTARNYNLTGACAACNHEKGDMTLLEYLLYRQREK